MRVYKKDHAIRNLSKIVVLPICLCLLSLGTHLATGNALPMPQAANIDEQLFLTYVVHDLYGEFPTDWSNPDQVVQELDALRLRSSRYLEYIKQRGLDSDLTSEYTGLITSIDAYTTFLSSIGQIQQTAADHIHEGHSAAGADAIVAGGATAADASSNGASNANSALAGLAFGAVSWMIDNERNKNEVDRAKQDALEQAGQQLKNQLASIQAGLNVSEMNLSSRRGWGKFEARSTDSDDESLAWKTAYDSGDVSSMLKIVDRKIVVRPRDPMLLADRQFFASFATPISPTAMRELAGRCLAVCLLVPAGTIYDDYRFSVSTMASDIGSRAFSRELNGKALGRAHSAIAAYAVDLWDTVLAIEPSDATGESRERRAWALMASGRLDDAVRQADEITALRGNTMRCAMNMARLDDARGNTDESFKWFKHAVVDLHFNDISSAKKDPDLLAMEQANAKDFEALVAVNGNWKINYGFFKDDITLTNVSSFPITDVTLSLELVSGSSKWTPVLKAAVVQPGETYTWNDCISIPGSKTDSSNATLACDQNQ